ncbi:MAG TPA: hypothetical protein PKE69_17910 [Pyrinomonadaceae bacterium]|nr:hypothetical protein [Pyrinomonadaceae bacterium]
MKKFTFLAIIGLITIVGLAGACSSGSTQTTTTNTTNNQATTNTAKPTNAANTAKTEDETPASVKAVFTDAQSFTTQHKDVPADKIASIEKDTGGKVPDKDHHSYLAFATKDGKRTQIGAATIVKAGGKELVVIYDNKDGSPIIKEVRGDGLSAEFLKQFAGKGHDDKFTFGTTFKANGVDEATAKAITSAIAIDVLTMQALYGSAHSH